MHHKRKTPPKPLSELLRFRYGPRSAIARKNRAYNRQFAIAGPVNGQRLAPVKDLRYGLTDMAHAGCGIIALYNALLLLDDPQPLSELAAWGDLYASFAFGLLGTHPWAAKRLFSQLGYRVRAVSDAARFESAAADAQVCLFTYWNRRGRPFKGMHTVCLRRQADGLAIYNCFDFSAAISHQDSFAAWLCEGIGPIVLYCIER